MEVLPYAQEAARVVLSKTKFLFHVSQLTVIL